MTGNDEIRSAGYRAARELADTVHQRRGERPWTVSIRSVIHDGRRVLWAATDAGSGVVLTCQLATDLALAGNVAVGARVPATITPPSWRSGDTPPLSEPVADLELVAVVWPRSRSRADASVLPTILAAQDPTVSVTLALRKRPAGWPR